MFWNENTLRDLFGVVCGRHCSSSFYLRYTYKPIFGHPILADEYRLCLAVRPVIETLVVELRLFMALVRSCVSIRNVAVDNAVVRYRNGLVVGAVKLNYVRQGEFSAPFCIVFRYYSSGFFAPPHCLRTLELPQHLWRLSILCKSALDFPLTATLFPLIGGG